MRTTVTLTKEESKQAAALGVHRCLQSGSKHCSRQGSVKKQFWENNIEGAFGEFAAAKVLGLPFEIHEGRKKSEPDLLDFIQVRLSTKCGLILRPGDLVNIEQAFVLVSGYYMPFNKDMAPATYTVVGWCWGTEAMQSKHWDDKPKNNGPPMYLVPNGDLHPIDQLITIIQQRTAQNVAFMCF